MQPQQPEPSSPGYQTPQPQSLEPQGVESQDLEHPPLNSAGRAYVLTAAVTTFVCLSVLTLLISGLWRAPLLAWPSVLLAYLRTKFGEMPKVVYGGLAVATLVEIVAVWFAYRHVANHVDFAGEKPGATAGRGALLFLRDFTIGVVVTIIEIITD